MAKKNCQQEYMGQSIKHEGIIDSIDGRNIRVRIVRGTACAGCSIAGHCNASEMKEKMVDVEGNPAGLSVGQLVVVSTTGPVIRRALLLGFVIPLFLLLSVSLGMMFYGYNDETSGLVALAALLPYYFMLWALRNRISRQVSFNIERQ